MASSHSDLTYREPREYATLSRAQLNEYEEQGFVLVKDCFSQREVDVLNRAWEELRDRNFPGRVTERDGKTVRSFNGPHQVSEVVRRLCLHPRLVMPARQILGEDIYIHQVKINAKAAFKGDVWQWHQDYVYWKLEDGMPEPRAVTAALFLDDVNEFNGPVLFVPRSHRHGVLRTPTNDNAAGWQSHVSADLKYALSRETVAQLVKGGGIESPKGRRGSLVFFHCNVVHGSPPNMSPFERTIALVTYNCVSNALPPSDNPRPSFLVNRDFTPIAPLGLDALASDERASEGASA